MVLVLLNARSEMEEQMLQSVSVAVYVHIHGI
jgi:hypothetical protein